MPPDKVTMRTDKERLAAIETEIGHLKAGIEEVYRYLREEFAKMVSNQIEDLRVRLEKAEGAIGGKASCTDVSEVVLRMDDFEKRIRKLEQNVWKAIGALAILAFLVPYIVKLISP